MFERRIDGEVSLALLEEQHAAELFRLIEANRGYLRRWLPWLDLNTTPAHTVGFIQASLRQFAARDGMACGILFHGAVAGVLGLHRIDWANRRTSIGYWIAEEHEGKGLVTRAVTGLLHYAFDELGLNRVEIACAPGNIRSAAIAERLGFVREGVLRQHEWLYDHFVDLVVYGMVSSQWAARVLPRIALTPSSSPAPSTPPRRGRGGSPPPRGGRASGRRRPPR